MLMINYIRIAVVASQTPSFPAVLDNSKLIFGTNAVCRFLAQDSAYDLSSATVNNMLDLEEFRLPSIFRALETCNNSPNSSGETI